MPLTDKFCKSVKCQPDDKKQRHSDGGGMYLEVTAQGSKYWRMAYRYGGKQKTFAIGVYPETSLFEAREKRGEARKLLRSGVDPSEAKQEKKRIIIEQSQHTFEKLARKLHKKLSASKWSVNNSIKWIDSLEKNVFPYIGDRTVSEIVPKDMIDLLSKMEARGVHHTAARVKQRCSQVFEFASIELSANINPTLPLRGAYSEPKSKNQARVGIGEMPELMRDISSYEGRKLTRLAMKFLAHTFVRTGELCGAEWTEFDFEEKQWRIPKERMKMENQHIVPLSKQVIAMLRELQTFTGAGRYVFPGDVNSSKSMSTNTIIAALYRMGYRGRMTGHGFRGVASTQLNEMGYEADWIERQLAHGEQNSVRAAYNHAQYMPQRIKMMAAWSDYLDRIENNVIKGEFGKSA